MVRTMPARTALQLALSASVFAFVYIGCNRLTHARSDVGLGVFDWERAIPFVPWTIVPYLSLFGWFVLSFLVRRRRDPLERHVAALMINLALSAACYLAVPLRFAFERPLPEGLWGPPFELLAATDLPYNRAPSLHISVALIVLLRLAQGLARWRQLALGIWFAAIGVSVLTTYQHHVIDIPAGLIVGGLSLWLARRFGGPRRSRAALPSPASARCR